MVLPENPLLSSHRAAQVEMIQIRQLSAPIRVEIAVTARCNLCCSYCHFFDSPNETVRELSTVEWLDFFHRLGQWKVFQIVISGGEALLRDDFKELVSGVAANNMRFILLTNGILLDADMAGFLTSTGRCDKVQFSLDGVGDVHDRARGKGAFEAAVKGIRCAQKAKLPIGIRISLGQHNAAYLEETAQYIIGELGILSFSTNWTNAFLGSEKNSDGYALSIRERLQCMITHQKILQKIPKSISPSSVPLLEYMHWKNFISNLTNGAKTKDGQICPAPFNRFAVRADGEITPCNHLSGIGCGNIREVDLSNVWQKSELLEKLRDATRLDTRAFAECTRCEYADYCHVSCPALAVDEYAGTATPWCYKKYHKAVPDFDFNKMEFPQ